MNATILERARAFALIAPNLTAQKRTAVAEAIADKLLQEFGGVKPPAALFTHPQAIEIRPDLDVTTFLISKDFAGAELVRKTAQLVEWLKSDKYSHMTRDARMQTWWASRAEGAA